MHVQARGLPHPAPHSLKRLLHGGWWRCYLMAMGRAWVSARACVRASAWRALVPSGAACGAAAGLCADLSADAQPHLNPLGGVQEVCRSGRTCYVAEEAGGGGGGLSSRRGRPPVRGSTPTARSGPERGCRTGGAGLDQNARRNFLSSPYLADVCRPVLAAVVAVVRRAQLKASERCVFGRLHRASLSRSGEATRAYTAHATTGSGLRRVRQN